jgi:putative hydrolase of the HAD superfamily
MKPLRAVLFDAGGTLIHPDRRFLRETLAAEGVPVDAAALAAAEAAARDAATRATAEGRAPDNAARGRVMWPAFFAALGCSNGQLERILQVVGRHSRERGLWTKPEAGAADALRTLRARGLALGVVSNSDGRVATFLDGAGFAPFLDVIVDSAVVGVEKPDPAIFRIACDRLGVPPAACLYVGDVYELDVLGARRAGMEAVLVDAAGRHAALDCPRIASVRELPGWLAARAAAAFPAGGWRTN